MTSPSPPHGRGHTLVELLIALAISSIGMSVAVLVALGQQRALRATESHRLAGNAGRDAFFELERTLHRAGFGVDPRFVFDFSWFRCASADQVAGVDGRPVCRDRVDGPDNLVFVARSPYYRVDPVGTNGCTLPVGCPNGAAWLVTAADASGTPSVTLQTTTGDLFAAGRSLLLVCTGGNPYTMVTVRTRTTATDGSTTLPLYDTSSANPYFENNFANACFSGSAIAYQLDRFQYSVRSFPSVAGVATTTPWLVLDSGLDLDGSGNDPWTTPDDNDLRPIAPYVEDLQVAYIMNRASGGAAPDTNSDWVVGNDRGASGLGVVEAPDATAAAPTYTTAGPSIDLANLHPANIRGVRISLAMRSDQPVVGQVSTWKGDPLPVLENEHVAYGEERLGLYHRWPSRMTIGLHNMLSRGMFGF